MSFKKKKVVFLLFYFFVVSGLLNAYSFELKSNTLSFEFLNDCFFRKDNKISSSWSIYLNSNIYSLSNKKDKDLFFSLVNLIPFSHPSLYYRKSFGIGQLIQTPDDLNRKDLIKDDVPYAGIVTANWGWYVYDNFEFKALQIVTGVVGPLSLGEQSQKTIHNKDPKGWSHQLHTEPIININFLLKKKLLEIGKKCPLLFDLSGGVSGGVGNLFTQGGILIESRFGYNVPFGFLYHPDPVGFSPNYKTEFLTNKKSETSIYFSLGVRGTGFLRNMLFDGNTFRKSHHIDKKEFVGQILGGFHVERNKWGIHFCVTITSDDVNVSNYKGADNEKFGIILFEWKI